MKTMSKIVSIAMMFMAGVPAMAALEKYGEPASPANGIWIQQVGEIEPQDPSHATLYYTKYEKDEIGDRVKSISYKYNGAGYLLMKPSDRKVICTQGEGVSGADGIVHHPDGKHLLIAGQGKAVHMVKKETAQGERCYVKQAGLKNAGASKGIWHLMMDYNQKWLWGANIPGELFRFSTDMRKNANGTLAQSYGFADNGYRVIILPDSSKNATHKKDTLLSTIIWDDDGRAFFTRSDYFGGGCEGSSCTDDVRKQKRANSYFGVLIDTTTEVVTKDNQASLGGFIGDKVITKLRKKVLIDSLEGAHGGTFDKYSGTIFLFGGARIVQIAPYDENHNLDPKVVAYIDLRDYFFQDTGFNGQKKTSGVGGWRLDQGTTDGLGHLFVASNTGHMVFVDFAGNKQKRINDNVLVHVQWMDPYLDDLAPLVGVGVDRTSGSVGKDNILSSSSAKSSSSKVVYSSEVASSSSAKSSSSVKSSSSSTPGNSSSGPNSSSSDPNSSSSGSNPPGSSSSDPNSSGSNPPGSSSSDPNSSGSNPPGSSSSDPNSSGSNPPGSSSSDPNSSGSNPPGSSSSSNGGGDGEMDEDSSSSSNGSGDGDMDDDSSSSSNLYYDADDDYEEDDGYDAYPSADAFDKGDTIASSAVILIPADPDTKDPNAIVIGGNTYLPSTDPGDMLDFRYDSGLDKATVGEVVAITLDPSKVEEYFGSIDDLKVVGTNGVVILDPKDGTKKEDVFVHNDGSVTILITADEAVDGGSIKIYGNSNVVIIDNINFVDPTPDARIGYIKDSDGNNTLDYVEVVLQNPLDSNGVVDQVRLVVNGDTLLCNKEGTSLGKSRDRIMVDVDDLKKLPLAGEFPKDATVLVTYKFTRGTLEDGTPKSLTYVREAPLVEMSSSVIKEAYAIRDTNGLDSLFLHFNIDLVPSDISTPEMLVLFKESVCRGKDSYDKSADLCALKLNQVKKVYMPTRNIVILVAKDYKLEGSLKDSLWKDSVSLFDGKTFQNLEYITSDEYTREVRVDVVDRFPSAKNVEYWDTDGDGILDQVVAVFDAGLTQADIENTLYFTFPWYSNRGMLTQMQVYPYALRIDPKDSTRVIWDVESSVPLAKGVTSIDHAKLPPATVFTYYPIFGETFVSEASAELVDKMPPIVVSATLNYGRKTDTLIVDFSEPIAKDLEGKDFFSYIHGKETLPLDPQEIIWSKDGFSAKLILDGGEVTILPGDSLLIKHGNKDAVRDTCGNIAGEKPQPVIIGGLLNHLVEATNMGSYDANDDSERDAGDSTTYTMKTVSSVNLRYVPSSTTKEDMGKEGALGHLVQLGERFVPQLVDRAQVSSDGTYDPSVLESIDPKDVLISFIVNFTDHLGQYVNDTVIVVDCNSPKFGGEGYSCLNTDKKVFVNWNFKDSENRFVGDGVYTVQFRMIVRYKDKKIQEEMRDKWGVRRKKHKRK